MSQTEMTERQEDANRLLRKAEEHLRIADGAYWDENPEEVALHLAYAQAAATTAHCLLAVDFAAEVVRHG